ncbi:MAG: VIT domain-containing protein [Polyangia bacterium]|nr:VIT domain-containing protein [Polyangia bacterium]
MSRKLSASWKLARSGALWAALGAAFFAASGLGACRRAAKPETDVGEAVATLQVVRPEVRIIGPDGAGRLAGWTARIPAGTRVLASSGRAWVHHDRGLRVLASAGAELQVDAEGLTALGGLLWVEAPRGEEGGIRVAGALVSAAGAGFEISVPAKGPASVYVTRGHVELRLGDLVREVAAGQRAVIDPAKARAARVTLVDEALWEDWTGGLAWPAPDAPAVPPGMGEIGARMPGSQGQASFPLAVRSLNVSARVDGDRVATVVDQVFFNPASDDLEGLYRVRLPAGAILQAFCIDRPGMPGQLACGYVKERQQARAEYRAQVYVGSREDPALLEWDAPGSYRAHLYPLKAGSTRRVVLLYSEWLQRDQEQVAGAEPKEGRGKADAVRHWRYPLATPGGSSPLLQEFRLEVDLSDSGAKRAEAGLGALVDGGLVVLQASDFRPRADFVLALRGGGQAGAARGYRSGEKSDEGRYLMVRVAPDELQTLGRRQPLDLVIVVDTSADTDPSELLLARATVGALLGHLDKDDRVAVLGADLDLRATGKGKPALGPASAEAREAALEALSRREVGGATDLGRVLAEAAGLLDPKRGGAVVYVGDGVPTVGEMDAATLRKRLERLARPVRLYGVAVGPEADLGLLTGLASHEGGLALRVSDRAEAASAALQVLGHASRPAMHRVEVSLGPQVERIFPARPVTLVAGEDLVVLGRIRGPIPASVSLKGYLGGQPIERKLPLAVSDVADDGDLRRRWATSRLHELLAGGAGREEVAELGTRFGLITAHTSFYVPSVSETNADSGVQAQVRLANQVLDKELQKQKAKQRERVEAQKAQAGKAARRPQSSPRGGDGDRLSMSAEMDEEKKAEAPAESKSEAASETTVAPSKDSPRALLRGSLSDSAASSRDERVKTSGSGPPNPSAAPPRPRTALDGLFGDGGGSGGGQGAAQEPGTGSGEGESGRPAMRGGGFGVRGSGGGGGGVGLRRPLRAKADGKAVPRDKTGAGKEGMLGAIGAFKNEKDQADELAAQDPSPGKPRVFGSPMQQRHRRVDVHVHLHGDAKPHVPKHCSPASQKPLEQRAILWRERLGGKGSPHGAREIWIDALRHCEAPRWRDRRTLLGAILDRLGRVSAMVGFARLSRPVLDFGAWYYLQRAIYARIRTAADLRVAQALFHPGQGVDWNEVERLLERLGDDKARARELLGLLAQYPADVRLKKLTLEILERAGEHQAAERLSADVAGNPYADAELRTAVGEYWARRGQPRRARRIFSEIVEFRPTDPRARRRLGDLYRAFGWYEEAYRQYQTLAVLAPHDTSVLLLMALAAAGAGRVDEALRLEQRVAESAAGSGGASRWALLWSSVRLAELREEARQKKDDLTLAALIGRTRQSGVLAQARPLRVILTWAHPEADLELWGAHPGWRPQRADELGPQFGIEAFTLRSAPKGRYSFEVRRVGRRSTRTLEATLWVLWDEGEKEERLQRFQLTLAPETKVLRFAVEGKNAEAVK